MEETLEARLERLEDLEAIRALLADYRRYLDGKDFRAYASLFAREGEFIAGEGDAIRASGPEAIFALVDGMRGTLLTDQGGDDVHVAVNEVIELAGDRATANSTWVYLIRGEGDVPEVSKIGHYEDELIREDGRWKFLRRRAPMDIPTF
ncbi:MAG TPA: nuclear transport factor 2 family protein [Solirubrobacteraceae bacterium]|nr:nuclear transport factor 2 family protein [Solirubrobacteraceae bacterium]